MTHEDSFAIVTPQLRRGEKAVWTQRPQPMARSKSKILVFLFGIPFFGFAVFWTHTAAQSGDALFRLFGIPYLLVGAGIMLSPVWSWVEAKNWLIYAITNQRLLIIRTFPRRRVVSFKPADITRVERTTKADGSGTPFSLKTSAGANRVATPYRVAFTASVKPSASKRLLWIYGTL